MAKRRLQARKPKVTGGGIPRISDSAANAAFRQMVQMLLPFHEEAAKKVVAAFLDPFAEFQPSERDVAELLAATRRDAESFFEKNAEKLADNWLGRVGKNSEAAVTRAVEVLGIEPTQIVGAVGATKPVFQAHVKEAVGLIKTIPSEHFDEIEKMVVDSIQSGNGVGDLIEGLKEKYKVTEYRANLIAYDQTNKAFQELNRTEMRELGIPKWQWIHSHGSAHPRKLHLALDGQTFGWDDPPVIDEKGTRGYPGQAVRCGCTQRPVLR